MRRRNRIVNIINATITIVAILAIVIILFSVKNKKYEIDIKSAISMRTNLTIIDCEYYDEVIKVLNKGVFKKTSKNYGGLQKTLRVDTGDDFYEFTVYEEENVITYKKDDTLYVNKDKKYVKSVADAIRKYDYALVNLDAATIQYYNGKMEFDTKYNVKINGDNTILLTLNKNISKVNFYRIFNDGSEILISKAEDILPGEKIAYYIDIDKIKNIRIEVTDDYKTNIYQSYIEKGRMKFTEITKKPEIVLNPTDLELLVGDEVDVSIENFDGLVEWYSEDENVAVAYNGIVQAVALGTTRVYVITQNNEYIYMNVSVVKPKMVPVNTITFVDKEVEVGVYATHQLKVNILPENATNQKLQWSSSDAKIAIVDSNGVVTGLKEGSAYITVKSNNGVTATCKVEVRLIYLEDISLNYETYDLKVGETLDLDVIFNPSNASIKDITWTTSSTVVAGVDASGLVTAKKSGTTKITATSKNGHTATCIIKVTN